MKAEAKKKLIKDLIPFIVTLAVVVIFYILGALHVIPGFWNIFTGAGVITSIIAMILVPIILGFEIGGTIVGWKKISGYIRIYNLLGLLIKLIIATMIGYILYPIIIVKDIIAVCKA